MTRPVETPVTDLARTTGSDPVWAQAAGTSVGPAAPGQPDVAAVPVPPAALEVAGLTAGYPSRRPGPPTQPVLEDIHLTVPAGGFLAVLGPSGCGKTTLLRVVAGLLPAMAGQVAVQGRAVVDGARGVPPERRHIGLVPQEAALFPHRDVAANVEFGLRSRRSGSPRPGRGERRDRVAEMLQLVGLPDLGGRYPHELSGGQRQRVALARALAPSPALVLLDEPFAALDAALRVDLRAEVREILREAGTATVLVTHDQGEALSIADRVAVLRDGRLVQHDTPAGLYDRPADAWVAGFVGDCTVLPGQSDGQRVRCVLGSVPTAAPPGPVEVVLRPEQVTVSGLAGPAPEPGPEGSESASGSADAEPGGVVTSREFFGHDTLYRLSLGPDERTVLARVPGPGDHTVGDRVRVGVAGPVHVLPTLDD